MSIYYRPPLFFATSIRHGCRNPNFRWESKRLSVTPISENRTVLVHVQFVFENWNLRSSRGLQMHDARTKFNEYLSLSQELLEPICVRDIPTRTCWFCRIVFTVKYGNRTICADYKNVENVLELAIVSWFTELPILSELIPWSCLRSQ
jgi:hypothetical protein